MMEIFMYLLDSTIGTFLVRPSQSCGDVVLSIKARAGNKHLRISREGNGQLSLDQKHYFATITALVQFYIDNGLHVSEGDDTEFLTLTVLSSASSVDATNV